MLASTSLMVPRSQLTRVAGINQTLQGALSIVGPPLGALLMALMPMHSVMLLDVGTAALAIIPLLFVHIPQPKRDISAEAGGKKPTIWADIREGVRYIRGWPGMMLLIGLVAILKIVNTPAISLMPLLVRSHFGGGAAQLSLLQAMFGVGIVLGGVVLSVWGGFQRKIYTVLSGMLLVGLGFLGLGLTPSQLFPMAVGYGFMMGFFVPMVDGPVMAILQSVVAPEMQGRVFTLIFSLLMLTSPLSLMVAGPISDWLGLQIWYILSGVIGCLFTITCFLIPAIRHIEDNPNGVPEPLVSSEPINEVV
jgi:DHA3 family macrolide efflux protein-like MFS transporter